jgi:hypothetical protein
MSDLEVMAAIGTDLDFGFHDERPAMAKSKKSFMQKLTERHEALKLSMRSPKLEELDQDEQRPPPSRSSSSSSASKDFFKISPTAWHTKSISSRTDFAMRYDDIASDTAPSPILITTPSSPASPVSPDFRTQEHSQLLRRERQCRRESSVMEMNATHRLYSSHSTTSFGSACSSPRTSTRFIPPKPRSRSLPSEMSDEQMDAWLDRPEDADAHRARKHSASSALSDARPTMAQRYAQRRKQALIAMENAGPTSSSSWRRDNPFAYDRSADVSPVSVNVCTDAPAESRPPTQVMPKERPSLTLAALPVEVVLEIARHLDTQSVARWRQTCTKIRDSVPAPLMPLAEQKT